MNKPVHAHQMFLCVLLNENLLVIVILKIMRGSFNIIDGVVFRFSAFFDIAVDRYKDMMHIKADHILVIHTLQLQFPYHLIVYPRIIGRDTCIKYVFVMG